MGIPVTTLTELDPAKVQATQLLLTQMLAEAAPSLDPKRGMVHDIILHYEAIFGEKAAEELERFRASMSLQQIQADPEHADVTMVDAVASNFRATRGAGSLAAGTIVIVLDDLVTLTIPVGMEFVSQGVSFVTETSFSAKTSEGSVIIPTDRLLVQLDEVTYGFPIEVIAAGSGSAYKLRKDATLLPVTPLAHFVKAFAPQDFTGGVDAETNAALAKRLTDGIAAKAISGRDHMTASLRAQSAFADFVNDSIIGFGDVEMLRDQHTIWPGSVGGGRADWYIRTQELPQSVVLTKTAMLIEKTDDGFGIWQITFERDDAPGFYEARSIIQTGLTETTGSYEITDDIRGLDLTELESGSFIPDVVTVAEGAYSRFQTAVIKFKDTDTATHDLTVDSTTRDYDVTLMTMPLLAEIQDYAAGRRVRHFGADVLVRAPIPCFLDVSIQIDTREPSTLVDEDAIKLSVAKLVNRYGFTGRLPASVISSEVYAHLDAGVTVRSVDILGRVRGPDGGLQVYHDDAEITLVAGTSPMVSGRTVAFILDPNDIAISVQTVALPDV